MDQNLFHPNPGGEDTVDLFYRVQAEVASQGRDVGAFDARNVLEQAL